MSWRHAAVRGLRAPTSEVDRVLVLGAALKVVVLVVVAAPELTEKLYGLVKKGQIEWIQENYDSKMLEGAFIVLAATDNAACNEQIVKDCRRRGILVNTAHRKEFCDFYFP